MEGLKGCLCSIFLTMAVILSISQNSSFAAEAYPKGPIQVVVPFEAGGPTDIGIRLWTDQLSKILKNPVLVINKPGAGGSLGTNSVVGAKNDGYTLLGGSTGPLVMMPITNPKEVSYDTIRDLEPIANCVKLVVCLVVRGDSPFNKFEDFEKYVKANPGKLNMGVSGINHTFLIYHLLKSQGFDMNLVVGKGTPQNVSFLLGGHVDVIINQVGLAAAQIREGKMKALVVFSNKRHVDMPDIPTIAEKGYPKAELDFWIGFLAPKGTPQPILDVLAAALKEGSTDPDTAAKLRKLDFPVDFRLGREFKTLIENQQKIIREIATNAKIIQ